MRRIIPAEVTGRLPPWNDAAAWMVSRYDESRAALVQRGVGGDLGRDDPKVRGAACISVVQAMNETGRGLHEYGFNPCNAHASSAYDGDAMEVRGRRGPEVLRAYPNIAEGFVDYWEILEHNPLYRASYPLLTGRDGPVKVSELAVVQQAGWGGYIAAPQFLQLWNELQRVLGFLELTNADRERISANWPAGDALPGEGGGGGSSSGSSFALVVGVGLVASKVAGWW